MNKLKLVLPLIAVVMLSFNEPSGQKAVIEFRQASVEEVFNKI